MQFAIFEVPLGDVDAVDRLNAFLRARRVLDVRHELVTGAGRPTWAFCVEYLDGDVGRSGSRERIDYRDVLDERQFAVFSKLREERKRIAEAEGIPVYAIFTNEQLAEMVRAGATSKAALARIPGVGDAKIDRFGEGLLKILGEHNAQGGESDRRDRGVGEPADRVSSGGAGKGGQA